MSIWKSPSSNIKYSEELWHCLNYYFNSKQWQNKLNKTKQEKKIKRTEAYLGHLPVAGPAGQLLPLAQPTAASLPCRLPPLPGGRARARRARPRAPATSSLPGCLLLPWTSPATPRHLLDPPRSLPHPHFPPGSLSLTHQAELVAAAAVYRGHNHPLAPLTCP